MIAPGLKSIVSMFQVFSDDFSGSQFGICGDLRAHGSNKGINHEPNLLFPEFRKYWQAQDFACCLLGFRQASKFVAQILKTLLPMQRDRVVDLRANIAVTQLLAHVVAPAIGDADCKLIPDMLGVNRSAAAAIQSGCPALLPSKSDDIVLRFQCGTWSIPASVGFLFPGPQPGWNQVDC